MPESRRVYGRNGVNGMTGEPLGSFSADAILNREFGRNRAPRLLDQSQTAAIDERNLQGRADLGTEADVRHPWDLAEAGWGVIFSDTEKPEIIQALRPLLEMRAAQAGKLYREYGPDPRHATGPGYKGEPKEKFLTDRGAAKNGPVKPSKMPYYLLIVGDPETIPFRFQYDLDVAYAVGRIHFDDATGYARYAQTVIAVETNTVAVPKKAVFFGASNPGDDPTDESARLLISPLHEYARDKGGRDWTVELYPPEKCFRENLKDLLGSAEAPALLVSATHGMAGYPIGSNDQKQYTGAIVCQDWRTPPAKKVRDCFFAGEDIPAEANLAGSIVVMFACFGAGYPKENNFWQLDEPPPKKEIAKEASVSALAKALLSHPNGGALAVMGHIERAVDTSFTDDGDTPALGCFRSAIYTLLAEGRPIGMASEFFNQKYAEIGAAVNEAYRQAGENPMTGQPDDPDGFPNAWTATNDARNYVIIGDPAVRLVTGIPGTRKVEMNTTATQAKSQPAPNVIAANEVTPTNAPQPVVLRPDETRDAARPVHTPQAYAISDDIRDALNSVGRTLAQAFQAATTITVSTYTNTDLTKGKEGAVLRAQTVMKLGGDTELLIPVVNGAVDTAVLSIHKEAMQTALTNRSEIVRIAMKALGLGG